MNKLLSNKKVLIGVGVVVLIVGILFATGAAKVNFSVSRTDQPQEEPQDITQAQQPVKAAQQPKLASRLTAFTSKVGSLDFTIKIPVGWSVASDSRVDFVAGALTADTLSDNQTFTANINAVADMHSAPNTKFADYETKWKDYILGQYPSMEFVSGYSTKINGTDTYIMMVNNTRPDGLVVRQIQYVFYLDDKYAIISTGSAPAEFWSKYEKVIKESIESLERTPAQQ